MADKVFYPPLVNQVPPQYFKTGLEQQATPPLTFSTMKNWIFSGGLNGTVGTTRSKALKTTNHISFFTWSIKGKPSAIVEIQLYATINGVTIPIIRHGMPVVIPATGDNEEFQDRTYNFIPPIILKPVTVSDTISVKCDGGSDGNFALIGYEEPF